LSRDRGPFSAWCGIRVSLLLFVLSVPLHAQRTNVLGTGIDIAGGISNNPPLILPQPGTTGGEASVFLGLFPMISLDSKGSSSSINATFAYGLNRFQTSDPVVNHTQTAAVNFQKRISGRWNLNASESFSRSSDANTFYALRGVEPEPLETTLPFSPIAANLTAITNQAHVKLDNQFSQRSTLSFSLEHSLRGYGPTGPNSGLSDQHWMDLYVTYSRRISERTSWNAGYVFSLFNFVGFLDAKSNGGQFGVSTSIAKDTVLSATVGLSHIGALDTSQSTTGYEVSGSIQRSISKNTLSFQVSQDSGRPNGIGSLSSNRQMSFGFSRNFGQKMSLFASASTFSSGGVLDNEFDSKGAGATANLGYAVSRKVSLQVGGQFQRYFEPSSYKFTQKRLFFSLRYSEPNFFQF
jgi:hypothetical protein